MDEKKSSNLLCLSLSPYFKNFHNVVHDDGNSIFLDILDQTGKFAKDEL